MSQAVPVPPFIASISVNISESLYRADNHHLVHSAAIATTIAIPLAIRLTFVIDIHAIEPVLLYILCQSPSGIFWVLPSTSWRILKASVPILSSHLYRTLCTPFDASARMITTPR
jgi:hypothetical protein